MKNKPKTETEKSEEKRMNAIVKDMVKELASELCLNGILEERIKCIDNAMAWSDGETTDYLVNSLPDPEKKYYMRNTPLFNAIFRMALQDEKNYIMD